MLKEIILDLLHKYYLRYGRPLAGRKKLQKLMFLVEYDIDGRRVRKLGYTGAVFKVLFYGPYSDEVAEAVEELVREGYVDEIVISHESPSRLINRWMGELLEEGGRVYVYEPVRRAGKALPPDVEERVEVVVEKYGRMSGGQLEQLVCERLGLDPETKMKYFGLSIDDYLRKRDSPAS
ncbi:MAG: hypothetical protein DRJ67_11015 [Thermoprotei archaeon]|nr:MAG: hypothetical protein DRJ67_11015 [Thermoprotei archaeon]